MKTQKTSYQIAVPAMKVLSHFYLFSHPNQLRSTPRTFMFPPYPINAIHLRIGGQVDYPNHSQMLRDPGEVLTKCVFDSHNLLMAIGFAKPLLTIARI
ncbi:hypothetical protein CDAR_24181 [Caerostris darwini]|uniref:Uncharacterized protein n=1 Tax=Caerostris darwini TaxID=1538125 RepID=A0AAV4QKE1_9ARAC|nr:hypothetical protein CDAR_24181 [Caerostris darwini]